ncbi:alpha-glycosidase [Paenibacillus sp. Soil766]|uniref:glycoside hydrolase family 13 protein n=1 Tax=Paenibacillus sp. Soil766 TaxID=1736404 RepID=UPI00070BE56F|nr:glycoside hydrolase family 13 protein [Paenibacillus sp. Soil766]KRE98510.1 alpha-glycosidase [Paenibacillus sp. Soil766]
MFESIYHTSEAPYAFALNQTQLKVRIRMKKNTTLSCYILHADRYHSPGTELPQEMEKVGFTRHFDYYETIVELPKRRLRYLFMVRTREGNDVWYGERGASMHRTEAGYFQFSYICDADIPQVPSWLPEAIVYQIFPDRFHNGDPANDPPGSQSWTSEAKPKSDSLFGGDIQGIIEKLPYLAELGVNTIYLTPIFKSPTNHKYDTSDYYQIDPSFGDIGLLKLLKWSAKQHGMRLILDAVFNHSGDQFFAFRDVLKSGDASPYKDWFHVHSFPIVQKPIPSYETFSHAESTMPKLNTSNPEVVEYLLKVARYWIEEVGIDGWRLDVANEVDQQFWRRLRTEVKGICGELALIGEIMHEAGPWLRGDQFDSVMNYLFREAVLDFFARQTVGATRFLEEIVHIQMSYTDQANSANLQLLGSHDTERFLTACSKGGWGWNKTETAVARMKLAVCFQFTYLGMPMIYYGDEIGMTGETDPDCRKPMIWESSAQNGEMLTLYRKLIAIRKRYVALTRGSFRLWFVDEARNALGFLREYDSERVAVIIHHSPNPQELAVTVPWSASNNQVTDVLNEVDYAVSESDRHLTVQLPAFGCAILTA